MPAFTFEKIAPPVQRGSMAPIAKKQPKRHRGVIVQMLDRFVEARVKRSSLREEKGVIARNQLPK
jgi:hypothetical protein